VPLLEVLDDDFSECAIFSQCVYWDERTDDEDGWFYKSYQDWHKECRVKERTCRRKLEDLKKRGWVETEVRQDYKGQNQLYVRVSGDKWIEDMLKFFSDKDDDPADKMTGGNQRCGQNDRRVQTDLPEGADKMTVSSICTKITPEITPEITIVCDENPVAEQAQVEPVQGKNRKDMASQNEKSKSNRKNKNEVTDLDREELQPLLDLYNQEKPARWDTAKSLTPSRVRNLRRLIKDHKENTVSVIRRGLLGAKRRNTAQYNWSIDTFIKEDNDWCTVYAESVSEDELLDKGGATPSIDINSLSKEQKAEYERKSNLMAFYAKQQQKNGGTAA
jgi:hypothetical protein